MLVLRFVPLVFNLQFFPFNYRCEACEIFLFHNNCFFLFLQWPQIRTILLQLFLWHSLNQLFELHIFLCLDIRLHKTYCRNNSDSCILNRLFVLTGSPKSRFNIRCFEWKRWREFFRGQLCISGVYEQHTCHTGCR